MIKVWVLLIFWIPPDNMPSDLSAVEIGKQAYRTPGECETARGQFIDRAIAYHSRGEQSRCQELSIGAPPADGYTTAVEQRWGPFQPVRRPTP